MKIRPEPWTADLAALRDHTSQDVPSLARTEQLVLASANTRPATDETKEKMMTFLRRRPVLAVALAFLFLALVAPVAYAVVDRLFLSIEPDASEEAIERDVTEQLEAAGIQSPVVQVEKSAGRLKLGIKSDHPEQLGTFPDLDVSLRGDHQGPQEEQQLRVKIEVKCDLLPDQMTTLTDVVSSSPFVDLVGERAPGQTDADVAAGMRAILAEHGFRDVEVRVAGDEVSVTVTAPPG